MEYVRKVHSRLVWEYLGRQHDYRLASTCRRWRCEWMKILRDKFPNVQPWRRPRLWRRQCELCGQCRGWEIYHGFCLCGECGLETTVFMWDADDTILRGIPSVQFERVYFGRHYRVGLKTLIPHNITVDYAVSISSLPGHTLSEYFDAKYIASKCADRKYCRMKLKVLNAKLRRRGLEPYSTRRARTIAESCATYGLEYGLGSFVLENCLRVGETVCPLCGEPERGHGIFHCRKHRERRRECSWWPCVERALLYLF